MATTKKQEAAAVEPGSNDEVAHLLALSLKYQIPQVVLVHDLTKAGLTPSRIASLILTTSNTVSQQKREKRPVWPPKAKVGKNGSD